MRWVTSIAALVMVGAGVAVVGGCGGAEEDPCVAEQTPPFLEAVTPTTEVLRPAFSDGMWQPTPLEALLRSEDACDDVELVLLVDYGFAGSDGSPWRDLAPLDRIPAATMADGPRAIIATWTPRAFIVPGCHTVTLLATHQTRGRNPGFWCPADPTDVSTITWFVALCEDIAMCDYGDCFIAGEDAYSYCADVR